MDLWCGVSEVYGVRVVQCSVLQYYVMWRKDRESENMAV